MVAVTHGQAAVGTLRDDEVHPVRQVCGLFALEARFEHGCRVEIGKSAVAREAEIRQERGRQLKSRRCKPQHLQLAAREPVCLQALRVQAAEVIPRADHDPFSGNLATRGLHRRRCDCRDGRVAGESNAVLRFEPGRQSRHSAARFDAQLDGALENSAHTGSRNLRAAAAGVGGAQQAAAGRHVGRHECFQERGGFGAACDEPCASLYHGNAGRRGDLVPHLAAAPRARPHLLPLLPSDSDKAKVLDRGTVSLRVAIDNDYPQSASRRRQRRREADNASADDGEVETPFSSNSKHCDTQA